MKILKLAKLFSFLLLLGLVVVSCSKDPVTDEETIKGELDPTEEVDQNSLMTRSITSGEGLELDCITIVFPFGVVDNTGTSYSIEDENDFISLLDPDGDTYIVDFEYPITITDEDGNESEVNDATELGEAFANCLPNSWDENAFPAYLINEENSCWNLQYPISVSDLDGEIQTFDDEVSFVAALAEEPLFFEFPISLINAEGEVVVANNVDELLTSLFDCNGLDIDTTIWDGGNGFDFIACYEIAFPFTVILTDGTEVEVNDHMEYCDLLLEGNIQEFSFPMTLIDSDGETIEVNSQEELDELITDCFDLDGVTIIGDMINLFLGGFGDPVTGIDPCYNISFPIEGVEVDWEGNMGNVVTFNNLDEIFETFNGGQDAAIYNVVYPVTVTRTEDGEVIVLENTQQLIDLLITCG
ncbi:MAG: hypothetical protein AAGA77_13905 [Bacteroidota bacterium]